MKNRLSEIWLIFFFICFLLPSLWANWRLRKVQYPIYATWTGGLRDLDIKLRQLEWISERGKVDSVFLGSSVQDAAMMAEVFTEELQRLHVPDSNAYNFALPAVGPILWPSIYRLMRLSTLPKQIFISSGVTPLGSRDPKRLKMIAGPRLDRTAGKGGFALNAVDFFLKSPASEVIQYPILLKLSEIVWRNPLFENAAALKDLLIYRNFKNYKFWSADSTPRSGHGDGISYLFNPQLKQIQDYKETYKEGLRKTVECIQTAPNDEERKLCFFADDDLRAIQELLQLAKKDRVEVVYAPLESTVGNLPSVRTDQTLNENRRIWHQEFARVYGLRILYFLDDFVIQPYELADGVHLNYWAGVRYGKMLARNWARAQGVYVPISNEDQSREKLPFYYSFEHARNPSSEELRMGRGFIILRDETSKGSILEMSFHQTDKGFLLGKTYTLVYCTPDQKTHSVSAVATESWNMRFKMPMKPREKVALIGRIMENDSHSNGLDLIVRSIKWIDS